MQRIPPPSSLSSASPTEVQNQVTSWKTKKFEFGWRIDNFCEFAPRDDDLFPPAAFKIPDGGVIFEKVGRPIGNLTITLHLAVDPEERRLRLRDLAAAERADMPRKFEVTAFATPSGVKCWNRKTFRVIDDDTKEEFQVVQDVRWVSGFCYGDGFAIWGPWRSEVKTIKVFLDIEFAWAVSETEQEAVNPRSTIPLPAKLKAIVSSKSLADFSIVCQGKKFRTHKFVLAMYSDVFAAMFERHKDSSEVKSGEVIVDDVDPEVMESFLIMLGGEEIAPNVLGRHALGLLKVAEKYNVSELRKISQAAIMAGMKWEDCVKAIDLAYLHEDKAMMSAAVMVAAKNKGAVLASEGWKEFKESRPEVAVQVMEQMFTFLGIS